MGGPPERRRFPLGPLTRHLGGNRPGIRDDSRPDTDPAQNGEVPVDHPISVGAVVRNPEEAFRTSTPLELFFDLCFVVAVAQASASLHHELVEGHVADGVVGFLMGFFGVWWAWMNFTWFASAHDADDVPYRLLTLLQMAGVLVYAAGVPAAVEDHVFTLAVVGYLIMRAGLITQWVRVARHHPDLRTRSLRYAGGIAVVQLLWLVILVTPPEWTAAAVPRPRHRRAARAGVGRARRATAATSACSTPSTSRSATACSRSSCSASRSSRRASASARSARRGSAPG